MKITFLGTGTSQGVPLIGCKCDVCISTDPKDNRLRSSVFVEVEGRSFVIDTGPDFRQQMLRERVKKLDAVIFTHGHKDHTAGFDDVRAFNYIQKKTMDVYADRAVDRVLRSDFHYCFDEEKYPGVPDIKIHLFDNHPFTIDDIEIIPIAVLHYKMPVYGFRIGDFTYITDANSIAEEELRKIKGSGVIVLNALRKTEHISHFNLKEAVDLAKEIGAEQSYFTHISHQMGRHADVERELPPGMHLAHDGLKVEIS